MEKMKERNLLRKMNRQEAQYCACTCAKYFVAAVLVAGGVVQLDKNVRVKYKGRARLHVQLEKYKAWKLLCLQLAFVAMKNSVNG